MKKLLLIALFAFPLLTQAFTVDVIIDTGRESVNAVEGSLTLLPTARIEGLEWGNSAILIWLNKPQFQDGKIIFSGISPGGFQGRQVLFSVSGDFSLSDIRLEDLLSLRNDGSGEAVPAKIVIEESLTPESDTTPPEVFRPAISRTPEIFDGNYFISFSASDKQSGVEHYEFSSTWLFSPAEESWQEADSPLELRGSELFKRLFVKAVDNNGNERLVTVSGPYRYAGIIIGFIIIVCLGLFISRSFSSRLSR